MLSRARSRGTTLAFLAGALIACGTPQAASSRRALVPVDRDEDGIPNRQDACPCRAEDRDGYEDDDGCPDRDNDRDGYVDACDACPNEPEAYNGHEDRDGCPDHDPERVLLTHERIEIVETVRFAADARTPLPTTEPLLAEIASVLQEHPELEVIEVEGHAAPGESDVDALATARAQAVVEALVERGIDASRLVARGYGAERPRADPDAAESNAQNRRVELRIVRMRPRTVDREPVPELCPNGPPEPVAPVC